MFGRIKARLFLQFRRKALITRRFYREVPIQSSRLIVKVMPAEFNVGLSRVWAQATRVRGKYVIREKELINHHDLLSFGKSKLRKRKYVVTGADGKKKKRFTREETIEILKQLEERFQKGGYAIMSEQPFKRRIYFNREAQAARKQAKAQARAAKREAKAAKRAARNSDPTP